MGRDRPDKLRKQRSPNFQLKGSRIFDNCAEEKILVGEAFHLTDHKVKFSTLHNC